jgi:hypothetical protein
MPPLSDRGPVLSIAERLPTDLLYLPITPLWAYFGFRYGGMTLPANANPAIEIGGLCGESKKDVLALLGKTGRARLAAYVVVPVEGESALARAEAAIAEAGLAYPLIAKPNVGRNGRGVKLVHSASDLAAYLAVFPRGQELMLQRYVREEGEAGVFYARLPGEKTGRITSLTLKYFPAVTGDGRSTIGELILTDERARRLARVYLGRHRRELGRVPSVGEQVKLASVGNHVRGAIFADGAKYVTPEMTAAFDAIAREMPGFFIGRFDVRFADIRELARGTGFTIVEFNGSGSEPTHIYDRALTLTDAWRAIIEHWRLAFVIGAHNRARGARKIGIRELLSRYFAEVKILKSLPDEE